MDTLLFTKYLQTVGNLTMSEAAGHIAEWGFDGADLTVREGGYVNPETVERDLPVAIETFEERGVAVPMITTEIKDASEDSTRVFETADDCGVEILKLGYWTYDGLGTLDDGLAALTADLTDIGSLARQYDVTPVVHVHSGSTISASGPLLADALDEIEGVAAYPDLGHLALEGGRSGWKMGLERLLEHAAVIGVKDYGWRRTDDGWSPVATPLGCGLVDWDAALRYIQDSGFDGPLSYHAEYDDPFDELTVRIDADYGYLTERLSS